MRVWIAALLLIAAGAGEARAADADKPFCTTLRRLMGAAGERPAFRSLGRAGPVWAASGLGFDFCRIVPDLYGSRLVCNRSTDRHVAGSAPIDSRIARCVPEALQMSEPEHSRLTRFRLGLLAFHVERRPRFVTFTLFAMPVERQ